MKFYTKNKQAILTFLFIIVLALLFNKNLANILLEIGRLINYHSASFFIAYIIILILIISGYLYVFIKPYVLNKKVTLIVGISVSIYMILLLADNNLHFETFIEKNKYFRYANILFLVGITQFIYLIININLKKSSKLESEKFNNDIEQFKDSSFIEDGLFVDGEIDNELILNRLLGMLSNFKPNSSFCVGLNAVWGHGKSSFLKRFEYKYRATSANNIIFWYNIWKNRESTAIIENFFDELKNNLTPHSGELSNSIDCYVEAILALSSSQTQTILNAGNKLLSQDKTLET